MMHKQATQNRTVYLSLWNPRPFHSLLFSCADNNISIMHVYGIDHVDDVSFQINTVYIVIFSCALYIFLNVLFYMNQERLIYCYDSVLSDIP